ncbi:MAG: hypothetical protein ACRENP_28035, partial [Longimicrobiales bacterium]
RRSTLAWLSRRETPPPFELERRVRRAIERLTAPATTVPDVLVAAAFQCMRDAARSGVQRSAANELLAADALLTYACEAAAEQGVDRLEQLTGDLDVNRFEELAREALT